MVGPRGKIADGMLRLVKLLVFTTIGFAVFFAGLAFLVIGIGSGEWQSLGLGIVALVFVAGWVVRMALRSRREAGRQEEVVVAKLKAGVRTCWSCKMDFDEVTSVKTPAPWWHLVIGVTLSLIPICAAGLGLWALRLETQHTPKLLFILIAGIGGFFYATSGRNRLAVRCPKCGRACGWVEEAVSPGRTPGDSNTQVKEQSHR